MNRKRWLFAGAASTLGVVAMVSVLALVVSDPPSEPVDPPPDMEDSRPVVDLTPEAVDRADLEIVAVETRALSLALEVTGRLQLDEERSARVGSPVEGRVTRIDVMLGDTVAAGEPLLRIYAHEFAVARADYFKARAALSAAERRHRYAMDDAERAERLLAAKAISTREMLRASVEQEAAAAELEQAKAELERAEEVLAHLGASPEEQGELVVRAPLPGLVLQRNVTVGTVVSPADDLILVSDVSSLWVLGEVPEREVGQVAVGQSIEIEVPAHPGRRFPARIFHVAHVLDPGTRTAKVRAVVDNTEGLLRPEMYANIHIDLSETEPLLAIPAAAIQDIRGATTAFVALGEGTFERRHIETGRESGGWTEIRSGLTEGERVVGNGSFLIKSEFLKGSIEED